jgi:hypothetical protein
MGVSPLPNPLYLIRTTVIITVLRFLAPPALTLAVALRTAFRTAVTILLTILVLGRRKKTNLAERTDGIALCH